ncbi:hypothetical protein K432DRAFT_320257 [Lepidopterella palustris CBS 459.81]|uniref:Transcriptional regulator n=1 Tax=Lepidopterella palustris CBS 459.81 TaxID=1314670 RepID=A0A8E2JJD8_9PEZI|nr:hypothetical protein K432DRAFT_320257 [Lepidopterella palustris CBS 459.81]
MSDSESDALLPSDAEIEQTLRNVVRDLFKAGKSEDITVRRVRTIAEKELGLSGDFLKNEDWKGRSKAIIEQAAVTYNPASSPAEEPTPPKKTKGIQKRSAIPRPAPKKTKKAAEAPRGVKRGSPAPIPKSQKRRKVAVSSDEESDVETNTIDSRVSHAGEPPLDAESEPKKPRLRRKAMVVEEDSDEEMGDDASADKSRSRSDQDQQIKDEEGGEEKDEDATTELKKLEKEANTADKGDISESEMSVLIDEPPQKNKRRKKSPSEKPAKSAKPTKPTKPKSTKTKGAKDLDPDDAEIKRLQNWLIKCGIRKQWHKELGSYDTSRAKIRHLRDMLKDAGMNGRPSIEKANKIKAERELAAELEAVQEGAKRWGQSSSEDERKKPKRRLARGLKELAVIGNDDGDGDSE